jgi:hypothetical protein
MRGELLACQRTAAYVISEVVVAHNMQDFASASAFKVRLAAVHFTT